MRLLYFIVVVAFIDTFSQLPIIAPFATSVGAAPLLVGIAIGMYSFSNIIGNIISGLMIDKIGSKTILWIGMVAVGIILILYSFVSTPIELITIRFLHGLAGGLIVPAAFVLIGAMKRREAKKGKAMAYSGAAVGIAAIVGPALGGILSSKFSYDLLFYVVSSLMVICGLLACLFINDRSTPIRTKEDKGPKKFKLEKPLIQAYVSIFLLLFTLGLLTYTLPLKVESILLTASTTGMLLSVFGMVAILFFILPTNKIYDSVNKFSLMLAGLCLIGLALLSLSFSSSFLALIFSMIIYGVGFAFLFPSTSAAVMEYSGESRQGIAFGIFYSCFSLGVVTGSFVAGLLAFSASSLFMFGAVFLLFLVPILTFTTK